MTTISQALNDARQCLQATSPSPAVDAGILLCHVLDCSPGHLIAWPDKQLSPHQASQFEQILQQRIEGKPVAYITGEREFWSLSFKVTSDVLIPRPETETLVEFVLEKFSNSAALTVADLGTGSGAIAIALASERSQLRPGQILFTYLHLAADRTQTNELLACGVTPIAYETVTNAEGFLPLLMPMSEVAGRMAPQVGASALQKATGGRGVLLGGVPGVPPSDVLILGSGVVGSRTPRSSSPGATSPATLQPARRGARSTGALGEDRRRSSSGRRTTA